MNVNPSSEPTIAELFPCNSDALHRELEEYRCRWNQLNGPVAYERTYTSQAPQEVQTWLLETRPDLYFAGLPIFARKFLQEKCLSALHFGKLDDLPSAAIEVFIKNGGSIGQVFGG